MLVQKKKSVEWFLCVCEDRLILLSCYGKNSAKQLIWLIENDKIVILALTQVLSVTIWARKY